MKLVDILARELKEWPDDNPIDLGQAADGDIHIPGRSGQYLRHLGKKFTIADDWNLANVTRAQWQEAREELSKPADFPSLAAKMCGIDMRESDASDNSEHPNWSEAPEGFDYFIQWPHKSMRDSFYKLVGNRYVRDNGYYAYLSDVADDPEIVVTKRPTKTEEPWNGEGLPPVGARCEAKTSKGWMMGTVIAHGLPPKANLAVWQEDGELIFWGVSDYFRPIRTPEQIAAEERSEFSYVMCKDAGHDSPTRGQLAMAEKLFDAGYRKVNDGNQKA